MVGQKRTAKIVLTIVKATVLPHWVCVLLFKVDRRTVKTAIDRSPYETLEC